MSSREVLRASEITGVSFEDAEYLLLFFGDRHLQRAADIVQHYIRPAEPEYFEHLTFCLGQLLKWEYRFSQALGRDVSLD